jgi:hypothetical protein
MHVSNNAVCYRATAAAQQQTFSLIMMIPACKILLRKVTNPGQEASFMNSFHMYFHKL